MAENADRIGATRETLLRLSPQFMESRVLLTAAELDLFTLLVTQPRTVPQIAEATGTKRRGLSVILDALSAMGLLVKDGEAYGCPPDVAASLSSDAAGSILPMVLHHVGLWQRWSVLTDVVRRGEAARAGDPNASDYPDRQEAFIGAMHAIGQRMADEMVAAIGSGGARRLLDVGGASGTYTQAFLEVEPDLRATIFDLPPVIEMARRRLAGTGLLDRIDLVPGDFYEDELPGGHDLALLSAIVHQNGPDQNEDLFRKIHRALTPGGRLAIRDHVMARDRARPRSGALFAVNMLVGTRAGGTYTFDELRDGLAAAGFVRVRLLRPGEERMDGVVEAFKPK